MAVSAAISVGSFTVVLAETFAAVAASTLIPATFLAMVREAKKENPENEDARTFAQGIGLGKSLKAINGVVASIDEVDLLVPKTAKIHSEFEFEASEAYAGEFSGGGVIQVVAVAAGFSALYETATRNKITLDVEFSSVHYALS